jgi:hypothetical protein
MRASLPAALALAASFLAAGAACAQDGADAQPEPTRSERIARGELPADPTDVTLRHLECRLSSTPVAVDVPGPEGTTGEVFRLPRMDVLRTHDLVLADHEADRVALETYEALPAGGIAGIDVCGQVILRLPRREPAADVTVGAVGMVLRRGLDGPSAYPTAWAEAEARGQLVELSEGCYARFAAPTSGERSRILDGAATVEGHLPDRAAFVLDDAAFLPVACPDEAG